jgi:DNA polymerase-3 subunit alpha
MGYVHLHMHTHYSLLDGANKISELMPKVSKLGMTAAAMTDHGNMFGVVDFYKTATAAGIKPIIGCEVYVAPRSRKDKTKVISSNDFENAGNHHLILLASNMVGYRNLSRLVSQSYIDGFYYKPRIDKEILEEWNEGLICLSGCLGGEVASSIMADRLEHSRSTIEWFSKLFGDRYYLEIQDNHLEEQRKVNEVLIPWSKEIGIPLVATNDCHYLEHEDSTAHEVLLCVQTNKRLADEDRWNFGTDQLFVKSPEQLLEAFSDCPEAIDNTLDIANRCNLELEFGKNKFPVYMPPPELEHLPLEELFSKMSRDGLEVRFDTMRKNGVEFDESFYLERLETELDMIKEMQFPGYFLIVQDFINWAKSQGIPVGPGRGSAAGSLVSYALRITNIDPIPYNLLFERFLNPARLSMPDIDVDFCYERRDQVLQYVREKYGPDKVANIITFGTMKGKGALRDVGRVLDFSFGETDRICKLYPEAKQGKDIPLAKALEMEPQLRAIRDSGEREAKLFEYAQKLEGLARHVSKHAAGVVISDRPLVEDVPLYVDQKDGSVMTQFAGPDVEAIGLVKFDFLGLKTLTLIADAVRRVKVRHDVDIDVDTLPLDDPLPYGLITRADTVGVFQMESGGMQKLLTRIKPSTFEDIVAVLALFRPGPLDSGMVEDYIKRKHGLERVRYDHADLEPFLRDTYGVIVYQEQVMQIAQVYSGFSLGRADNLRRAMGKKKDEAMAKERIGFVEGAEKLGRKGAEAEALFDSIQKFAAYGFNKSHSAAYALVTFQTAWLKAHYTIEFLAALLTLEMGSTDNTYKNLADCRRHGIAVLPADVNSSCADFTVCDEGIRFGLSAIKGIGDKAVDAIVKTREEDGPFRSMAELCLRCSGGQVTRRVIEGLIKAGAFASISDNRAALLAGVDQAFGWASNVQADRDAGQMGLFGGGGGESHPEPMLPNEKTLDSLVELDFERDALGFYISGHPLDRYEVDLSLLNTATTNSVQTRPESSKVRLAGVANAVRRKNSKKGARYATFQLEDREGAVEVIAWPETYKNCEAAILCNKPLLVTGSVEFGTGGPMGSRGQGDEGPDFSRRPQIIADEVVALSDARRREAHRLELRVVSGKVDSAGIQALGTALSGHPGACRTWLRVIKPGCAETLIELPAQYGVDPVDSVVEAAEALVGNGNVSLHSGQAPST